MRKRVLIFTATVDFGGAERTVVDTAKALGKSKNYQPVVCSLTGRGDMEKELIEADIEYHPLQIKNIKSIFSNIKTVRQLIKKIRPDIIHTHQGAADFYGSVAAIGFKIPIISHVQNPDMPQPLSRKAARLLASYFLIDYFTVAIDEKAEKLKKLVPFKKDKISILHNVIDPKNLILPRDFSKEIYREKFSIPKNAFVIGSVGRLAWEKGYDLLLEAFNELRDTIMKYENLSLVIVGSGPEEDKLKKLTKDLGIENKVLFAGYRKDTALWMSLFDIFVVSSKLEAFPLVSLEAMYLGLPVIITDRLSSKDILSRAALVVPCSVEGIKNGIIRLIENKELREEMSKRGREMVREEFTIDTYIKKLEEIYDKVLNL